MSKKKQFKTLPHFEHEDAERDFWATHSVTDYFDMSNAVRMEFPNLKFSTETISLRMPLGLLDQIKMLANRRDVLPYQSLIKIMLDEKVKEMS